MPLRRIALLLVALLLLGGCVGKAPKPAPTPTPPGSTEPGTTPPPATTPPPSPQPTPQPTEPAAPTPAETEQAIRARAGQVLAAFQQKDRALLASLVHPTKGVRFSPYAFVRTDADGDLRFTREQLTSLDPAKIYVWGVYDGRGNPIELTFGDYVDRFVYQEAFSVTAHTGYDQALKTGNTMNNIKDAYPAGHFVEFHFPGTQANTQMDWASLRLVFEQEGGEWYLVGVVHDQWTI